tara:strand:+ start:165 stop:413 length:249 start_codon:yes stop_codon:yes gene_type:complete
MTDREILDEVYNRLKDRNRSPEQKMFSTVSFIEQEWQKEDDKVNLAMYNRNRPVEERALDVQEIERHRGLEIGEDGTVKELK